MEILFCDRTQCEETATKFCLSCKAYLCNTHMIDDVKVQQASRNAEHYHTDALQYSLHEEWFAPLYCKMHPHERLTCRCINCFQFACNSCPPEWCGRAAGRYHNYDMIKDVLESYKGNLSELQSKLQDKHACFLLLVKKECQIQSKAESDLEELLHKVDMAVKSKIAAITEEGEKLKSEIAHEMSEFISQINQKVKSVEEKEAMSQKLLHDIHEVLQTANGDMAIHHYKMLEEEAKRIIDWKTTPTVYPRFSLSEGKEWKSLDLQLMKEEETPIQASEEVLPALKKGAEIIRINGYKSGEQACYMGHSFLSKDRVITYGWNGLSGEDFTETKEADLFCWQLHVSPIIQLLPYGNQLLLLTFESPNLYKISLIDEMPKMSKASLVFYFRTTGYGSEDLVMYEDEHPFCHTPFFYFSHKLMSVTRDDHLMVLVRKTQTLLVRHMATKADKIITLSVGKSVYGIMTSYDNNLILLCKESENKKTSYMVIKYGTETEKVIWVSDTLLTYELEQTLQSEVKITDDGEFEEISTQDVTEMVENLNKNWLHVAGYMNYLYVINRFQPEEVLRLNLSDGSIIQRLPCHGFPMFVYDISLRGSTLALAGGTEGITYFTITDITAVI